MISLFKKCKHYNKFYHFLRRAEVKLDQYGLLIMDDIGYVRKDEGETHVLFELIAHRYESRSLMVTSNQPFRDWDQIFATNSMTVAAIDRLVHHATILEISSESYRKNSLLKITKFKLRGPFL